MPMSSRKLTEISWKALAYGQSVQTFQLEQKGMLNTFVSVKLAEACGSRTHHPHAYRSIRETSFSELNKLA